MPGVKIQLTISVDEYDPFKPSKGVVKCVAINKSRDSVEVSLGYDQNKNWLKSQGEDRLGKGPGWVLTLNPAKFTKEELKRISVKPNEEQVVFELSLDEILLQGVKNSPQVAKDRKWWWQWQAHPAPPATPIHLRRGGFVKEASFWAEVVVNDKTLFSEKKVLKVKPSAGLEIERATLVRAAVAFCSFPGSRLAPKNSLFCKIRQRS